jgi:hypothetical protein
MASTATWLKDILPQTPGANRQVAKRELLLACREFFEQSAAWRVVVVETLIADDPDYSFSPYDSDTNVTKILSVEFNGTPLRKLARRPAGEYPDADSPTSYFITEPDTIHLWPNPQVGLVDGLTVEVALVPNEATTTLPAVAASLYYDAIRDGVLGRLFAHPAKPYSDATKATYHLNRFRAAIGKYAGRAKSGNGQNWTYPCFGK